MPPHGLFWFPAFQIHSKPHKIHLPRFLCIVSNQDYALTPKFKTWDTQNVKTASQMSPSNIARIINVSHNFKYMHQFFALQISRNSKFYFYFLRKEQRTLVAID